MHRPIMKEERLKFLNPERITTTRKALRITQTKFNIIYIAKGHDEVTTILVGKYHGYFWRKVNQNQQYTACC